MRYSPGIQKLLVRSAFVIFFASSFWALLPAVARVVGHSSLGYGLLLGFFGTGAVLGAVLLQRLRKTYSVEGVVAVATAVFACVLAGAALLHNLWILSLFSFFGGAAWTIFMSVFNTLIQRLASDWVRARVLAVYLFVFQGSMAIGSIPWGVGGTRRFGKGASRFCGGNRRLPALTFVLFAAGAQHDSGRVESLAETNNVRAARARRWPRARHRRIQDRPGQGAGVSRSNSQVPRIRRRDGATRWGVYYDSQTPGVDVETFLVDSWAEQQRQHHRITMADRTVEEQVFHFALEPVRVRHFIYARASKPK